MKLKEIKPAPELDRSQPYGEIYGGTRTQTGAGIYQAPHYYRANGEYLGTDPSVKVTAPKKAAAAPRESGSLQVTEEELPELLKHDRAEELMSLPLDKLQALVGAAGGPSYSGDRAHMLYTGWLIKHTNVDG
ncbi:MAG: hypothetical protein ACRDK7_10110 [Solirubrobacteraceae bacterium]